MKGYLFIVGCLLPGLLAGLGVGLSHLLLRRNGRLLRRVEALEEHLRRLFKAWKTRPPARTGAETVVPSSRRDRATE